MRGGETVETFPRQERSTQSRLASALEADQVAELVGSGTITAIGITITI